MKTGTVYIIRNTINDRIYIGSTTRKLNERMREHKSRAITKSKNSELYDDMRLYGCDCFSIEAIKTDIPESELLDAEYKAIKQNLDRCYNSFLGLHRANAEEMIRLYNDHMTIKQISVKLGHCKKTVSSILKANDVEITDWNECQRFKEDPETIRGMYEENMMSTVEIGAVFGVSNVTILKFLKRNGITVRKAVSRKYL